ncbi:MAG: hypothetical protein L0196_11380 [candidate division Zixibacteria bacterium]|nr:hypothetical protein [candidate division Zixibacteria bacterium]
MRREIPLFITSVVGFIFVIRFFIPHEPFYSLEDVSSSWIQVIQAFAIWLGILNLLKVSLDKIYKKERGWGYSGVIIFSFLAISIAGFFFPLWEERPAGYSYLQHAREFLKPGTSFDWFYWYVYSPLSSTMFATLAFFIASASFRAFRARSFQATLLLLSGFVVMFGSVPVGNVLFGWLPAGWQVSDIADWVRNVPQVAGQRAIQIGIALGIISTSLRLILGLERAHLGREE